MIIDRAYNGVTAGHNGEDYILIYFWMHQPRYRDFALPEGKSYKIDIIDTWNTTITEFANAASGSVRVTLPRKKYMALRIQKNS